MELANWHRVFSFPHRHVSSLFLVFIGWIRKWKIKVLATSLSFGETKKWGVQVRECFNSVTLVSSQLSNPPATPWKPLYQPWFIAVGGVEKMGPTTVRALWGGGALRVSAVRRDYCKKILTAARTYKSKPVVQRISQTHFEVHEFMWLRLKHNACAKPFSKTHV